MHNPSGAREVVNFNIRGKVYMKIFMKNYSFAISEII